MSGHAKVEAPVAYDHQETVTVAEGATIYEHRAGEDVVIDCHKDGTPLDPHWARRILDGSAIRKAKPATKKAGKPATD